MSKLVKKRILAFLIDYILIILYAVILAGISMLIYLISGIETVVSNPVNGQIVGFFTLTLPVFLYFYHTENGSGRATVGKRKMGLNVQTCKNFHKHPVFMRNVFKFIPWEIAHFGVHWIVYYSHQDAGPPSWILIVLIIPQLIVIAYIMSIFTSKGKSSIYDKSAGTCIAIVS